MDNKEKNLQETMPDSDSMKQLDENERIRLTMEEYKGRITARKAREEAAKQQEAEEKKNARLKEREEAKKRIMKNDTWERPRPYSSDSDSST